MSSLWPTSTLTKRELSKAPLPKAEKTQWTSMTHRNFWPFRQTHDSNYSRTPPRSKSFKSSTQLPAQTQTYSNLIGSIANKNRPLLRLLSNLKCKKPMRQWVHCRRSPPSSQARPSICKCHRSLRSVNSTMTKTQTTICNTQWVMRGWFWRRLPWAVSKICFKW